MAQTIFCDGECGHPAALMITLIGTGDVLAFCPQCSVVWAEGHVAAMTQQLAPETPGADGAAGSGDLEAGGDTPESDVAADPAAGASGSPVNGQEPDTAPEGGGASGAVREHDRRPDDGDRSAADRPGTDDAGGDRPGGPGKGRRSSGGGGQRRRSARSGVAPDVGT